MLAQKRDGIRLALPLPQQLDTRDKVSLPDDIRRFRRRL
jgi:hypothetical protein